MKVDDWDTFAVRAEAIYRAAPLRTRYVVKYRHAAGKLSLKVTDDVQCVKYATDQIADVKRMEKLNNTFFALTARGPEAPPEQEEEALPVAAGFQPTVAAAPAAAPSAGAAQPQRKGKNTRRRG